MNTKPIPNDNEIRWVCKRDLSTLSLHAGIEMDSLKKGSYQGLNSVQELAETIENFILAPQKEASITLQEETNKYSLLNPTTVVIINRAFVETQPQTVLENIEDFVTKTEGIFNELIEIKNTYENSLQKDDKKLEELSLFCLALSKQALAEQQFCQDSGYHHPYKI